jgi:hypothetical protein
MAAAKVDTVVLERVSPNLPCAQVYPRAFQSRRIPAIILMLAAVSR